MTQTTREKDYYFDISQEEHNVCDNAYNDLTIVPSALPLRRSLKLDIYQSKIHLGSLIIYFFTITALFLTHSGFTRLNVELRASWWSKNIFRQMTQRRIIFCFIIRLTVTQAIVVTWKKNVMELFNSVVERRKWRSVDSCLKTGRFSWAAYVTSIVYGTSMFLRENMLFYF